MFGWIATALTAAIFSVLLWNSDRRLGNALEDVAALTVSLDTAVDANATNLVVIADCERINRENEEQREDARIKSEAAADRIVVLETELEDLLSETFTPTDTTCRTLLDDLPLDFSEWLCLPGAANCSTD